MADSAATSPYLPALFTVLGGFLSGLVGVFMAAYNRQRSAKDRFLEKLDDAIDEAENSDLQYPRRLFEKLIPVLEKEVRRLKGKLLPPEYHDIEERVKTFCELSPMRFQKSDSEVTFIKMNDRLHGKPETLSGREVLLSELLKLREALI